MENTISIPSKLYYSICMHGCCLWITALLLIPSYLERPSNLTVSKMSDLGFQHKICLWIQDLLTNWPQSVRTGPHHSALVHHKTVCWVLSFHLTTYQPTIPTPSSAVQMIQQGWGWSTMDTRKKVQRQTDWCTDSNMGPDAQLYILYVSYNLVLVYNVNMPRYNLHTSY